MFGRSAVKDLDLHWYTNGKDNVYVSPNDVPLNYYPGRHIPSNYGRIKERPCIDPKGKIFNSIFSAAKEYKISHYAIRERIRRSERNISGNKKSGWKYL